jgi:hypothetical protein
LYPVTKSHSDGGREIFYRSACVDTSCYVWSKQPYLVRSSSETYAGMLFDAGVQSLFKKGLNTSRRYHHSWKSAGTTAGSRNTIGVAENAQNGLWPASL